MLRNIICAVVKYVWLGTGEDTHTYRYIHAKISKVNIYYTRINIIWEGGRERAVFGKTHFCFWCGGLAVRVVCGCGDCVNFRSTLWRKSNCTKS